MEDPIIIDKEVPESKPVHTMSMAELSKSIVNAAPEEQEPSSEDTPAATEGEVSDKKDETAETEPPKVAANAEPEKEDVETGKDKLRIENEALKKKVEHQDKFFARLGTEIGLLRKQTPPDVQAQLQEIRNLYTEDPVAGTLALNEYIANQNRAAQEESDLAQNERLLRHHDTIRAVIPDMPNSLGEMAEIIREDGGTEEIVRGFIEMPYHYEPAVLLNLYKRVEDKHKIADLEKQLEALKKEKEELVKKPNDMLKKIEQATGTKPLTGKSSGGVYPSVGDKPNKPLHLMSRDELRKLKAAG